MTKAELIDYLRSNLVPLTPGTGTEVHPPNSLMEYANRMQFPGIKINKE